MLRHGPPQPSACPPRRGRPLVYGPDVLTALEVAAEATGWICGKRPALFLDELIPALEQEGALAARARLPCALVGIDSDHGCAFLTAHRVRWCQQEQVTFTRCRTYHTNDQAHVEQQNGTVVRQFRGL